MTRVLINSSCQIVDGHELAVSGNAKPSHTTCRGRSGEATAVEAYGAATVTAAERDACPDWCVDAERTNEAAAGDARPRHMVLQ